MRVCYFTLGTYNAVLAWLVKKAEDNQVELPFIFPVGVLVFQFSRERRRENLMMVISITYLYLYLQCQLHGLYICYSRYLIHFRLLKQRVNFHRFDTSSSGR